MKSISPLLEETPKPTELLNLDPDALASEQSAAEFLGVTPRALQKWRMTGEGPRFVRISSRCVRYRRRELVEWAQAHLKASTSE
jgi:predicted DNA-binding transcriptional regulator AlpA